MDFKYDIISTKSIESSTELPKYFLGSTAKEAENTFEGFKSYINNIANTYASASNISKDDLFSECVIALAKAKKDFDPERGSDFRSYAKYIIVDALNEFVRKNKSIVQVPSYINKANKTINKLKNLFNNDSLWYSLAFNNEYDPKGDIEHNKKVLHNAAKRSKITCEELIERSEFLPFIDHSNDFAHYTDTEPMDNADAVIAKVVVDKILCILSESEQRVAELLMTGLNKTEIAKTIGKSDQFVSDRILAIKSKVLNMITGERK